MINNNFLSCLLNSVFFCEQNCIKIFNVVIMDNKFISFHVLLFVTSSVLFSRHTI